MTPQMGIREDVYTVRYNPLLNEAIFAVRIPWRPKWENTPEANNLIRLRFGPSPAKTRLDQLWYTAMQHSGEL